MTPEFCPQCGGDLIAQSISHGEWWGDKLYIFRSVPVLVCMNCGEKYFSDSVLRAMDKIVQEDEEPDERIDTPVFNMTRHLVSGVSR